MQQIFRILLLHIAVKPNRQIGGFPGIPLDGEVFFFPFDASVIGGKGFFGGQPGHIGALGISGFFEKAYIGISFFRGVALQVVCIEFNAVFRIKGHDGVDDIGGLILCGIVQLITAGFYGEVIYKNIELSVHLVKIGVINGVFLIVLFWTKFSISSLASCF